MTDIGARIAGIRQTELDGRVEAPRANGKQITTKRTAKLRRYEIVDCRDIWLPLRTLASMLQQPSDTSLTTSPCPNRFISRERRPAAWGSHSGASGSDFELHAFFFLQISQDLKQIAYMRIAARSEYSHQTFCSPMGYFSQFGNGVA